jgi:hypothetical protein
MLYADFYTWLESSLDIASKIKGVNWIVKPHPAAKLYGELGEVKKMVARMGARNIFLAPDDMSPFSVKSLATAIITAQGTVGLEYSCLGIPSILASNPFYSGFGFTIEPSTVEEYQNALVQVVDLKPLAKDKIIMSKKVYGCFMNISEKDNSLIDSNVLLDVWGSESGAVPDKAYLLLADRLATIDPRKHSLFKKAEFLARSFLTDLSANRMD